MIRIISIVFFLCLRVTFSFSQNEAIKDNSFLVEEAYNQEKGVIQHILYLEFDQWFRSYKSSFTEEWPLNGEGHQVSCTVLSAHDASVLTIPAGLLNYRYQLLHTSYVAVSPRASIQFPFRNDAEEGLGFQIAMPVSFSFDEKLFIHLNTGFYSSKSQRDFSEYRQKREFPLAIGADYVISPNVNIVLEFAHSNSKTRSNENGSKTLEENIINPGFRFAINTKAGLQIVPAISMPYYLTMKQGGFVFYLSFEHSFNKGNKL